MCLDRRARVRLSPLASARTNPCPIRHSPPPAHRVRRWPVTIAQPSRRKLAGNLIVALECRVAGAPSRGFKIAELGDREICGRRGIPLEPGHGNARLSPGTPRMPRTLRGQRGRSPKWGGHKSTNFKKTRHFLRRQPWRVKRKFDFCECLAGTGRSRRGAGGLPWVTFAYARFD